MFTFSLWFINAVFKSTHPFLSFSLAAPWTIDRLEPSDHPASVHGSVQIPRARHQPLWERGPHVYHSALSFQISVFMEICSFNFLIWRPWIFSACFSCVNLIDICRFRIFHKKEAISHSKIEIRCCRNNLALWVILFMFASCLCVRVNVYTFE